MVQAVQPWRYWRRSSRSCCQQRCQLESQGEVQVGAEEGWGNGEPRAGHLCVSVVIEGCCEVGGRSETQSFIIVSPYITWLYLIKIELAACSAQHTKIILRYQSELEMRYCEVSTTRHVVRRSAAMPEER
jgi:hypothetical protein